MAPKRRKSEVDEDWVLPSERSVAGGAAAATTAAATAAPAPDPAKAWGVRVSRSTLLVDVDEELYLDCKGEEWRATKKELKREVTAHDGTWWTAKPTKPAAQRGGGGSSGGGSGSGSGSGGDVRAFPTLEAANARAAKVWAALQAHPPPLFRPVDDEDENSAPENAAAAQQQEQQLPADGRARYSGTQAFYADPYGDDLEHVVESSVEVAVVPLRRRWVPAE